MGRQRQPTALGGPPVDADIEVGAGAEEGVEGEVGGALVARDGVALQAPLRVPRVRHPDGVALLCNRGSLKM